MHKILDKIINDRNGHYIHALEVNNLYDLTSAIETLTSEFNEDGFSLEDIKDFFNTMSIYYLGEDEAEESLIYDLNIEDYLTDLF